MKKFDYSFNPETGIHRSPTWRIAGYALNDSATISYMIMMSYISYFMIGFVGVATVFATSFIAMMRVWDGVTDPLVGMLVDRTNGRFGKNRPFLVIGNAILCASSFILFYVTPMLPEWVRLPFFVVITLIYYIGYTCQCIITKSALSCMTNDPKQRSWFGMFLNIFNTTFGVIVTIYISSVLVPKYSSLYEAGLFREIWAFVAILSGILTMIAFISISKNDRPEYFGLGGEPQKTSLKDYWEVLKKNRALQMLVLAASSDKLASLAKISTVAVVLYGVLAGNFALNGGFTMYSTFAGIFFGVLALGVLSPKIGLKKSMVIGSWGGIIINVILAIVWIFGDAKTLSLPGFVNGYGEAFSGISFFTGVTFSLTVIGTFFSALSANTVNPMIADCADYETYLSGRYVPGMIGTLFSFVDKLVSAFAPVIGGLMFSMIGFSDVLPDVDTPETPALRYVAVFLAFGLVIIGYICNLIAMKFYPLTSEKMKEIREEIHRIKSEQSEA